MVRVQTRSSQQTVTYPPKPYLRKYFQANDKARTGYLAAVQARNLLLQTGLAQQTLATVWNLADIDKVTGNW